MAETTSNSSRFPPLDINSYKPIRNTLPKSAGHEDSKKKLIERPVKSATFDYSWQQEDDRSNHPGNRHSHDQRRSTQVHKTKVNYSLLIKTSILR